MTGGNSPEELAAELAAERAADEGRLMPGEDPTTVFPEDIEHWLGVYQELLAFKRDLLNRTKESVGKMDGLASDEIASTDLVVLQGELERLQARLDFWESRRRDLS